MTPAAAPEALSDAELAATLFAIDPVGLGGVVLRGGPGPERDAWLTRLRELLPADAPIGRIPLGIADDRLLGGLDLSASLAAGRPVAQRGVLAAHDGGVVVLPMAERLDAGVAARIAAVLDTGEVAVVREGLSERLPARLGLVLLDEGAEPEERPPAALTERLAFLDVAPDRPEPFPSAISPLRVERVASISMERAQPPSEPWPGGRVVSRGENGVATSPADDALVEALCAAAAALGVESLRAPLFALRAAQAHAVLRGRATPDAEDAAVAARLVLAPRATRLPLEPAEADEADTPPPSDASSGAGETEVGDGLASDRVLAAVQAALPEGLLERIVADNRRATAPRRAGAGAAAKAARRGRPLSSRPGELRGGARLDVPATLRAAAPWQRLRGASAALRVQVRPTDFRIRRFVQRRESTTVFVVDASGSAAFQRLAEAKGAVELLLAKAYVSRARVALVAFRQVGAEVLLSPTRSLTRARNRLADLPGGGGTPLAAGLDAGLALALAERAHDRTPVLVVLTDGRANVALDGAGGREAAERDALAAAGRIGEAGIDAAFLDTSPRPQPGGDRFARAMRAAYAPLPYADPARIAAAVASARGPG